MEKQPKQIPEELENDAIIEALLEIRFDMKTIPEVFFGRLADYEPWKDFEQKRLPTYEIPPPVRQADENLRFQPVFELQSKDKKRLVRVGAHVVSFHKIGPYGGWATFKPELDQLINAVFSRTEGLTVRRLGLRYINAINKVLHKINSPEDLDMELTVEGEVITEDVNLNFFRKVENNMGCTVRVATPSFIQGKYPTDTSIIVDVDLYTGGEFKTQSKEDVIEWAIVAHDKEKEQFFGLLTQEKIDELRKK